MTEEYEDKEVLFCFAFPEFHPRRLYASGISRIHRIDSGKCINVQHLNALFDDKTWLMGWMGYGLKSQFEKFNHQKSDYFPHDMCWIEPQIIFIAGNSVEEVIKGSTRDALEIFEKIHTTHTTTQLQLQKFVDYSQYREMFSRTMTAIMRGDIYEANLCLPFDFRAKIENPYALWMQSLIHMNAPFSCFAQYGNDYALSFSPERFLEKKGVKIISQPIKGTVQSSTDSAKNHALKNQLQNSFKDLTENRMVVDLLRNDFSRVCKPGSIVVEELAEVKSYPGIHHLVSTVAGQLNEFRISEILKATFPMASMTGIPKHRMISLMDEIEGVSRGVYSGSFGYKKPNGDFDFNVVIRTLLYNSARGEGRINAGGAITSKSSASQEYEECLIKIRRLITTLDPNFDLSIFGSIQIS